MDNRQSGGGGQDDQAGERREITLENNVRNIRALLDQARQAFGPETRRIVDQVTKRTVDAANIETINLEEHQLDPAAWTYLALVQTIETVNTLVVQLQSSPAFASTMMTGSGATAGSSSRR